MSIEVNPVLILIIFTKNHLESGQLGIVIIGPFDVKIRHSVNITVITIWGEMAWCGVMLDMPKPTMVREMNQ